MYIIQDRETGTFIDSFDTYDEALEALKGYGDEDKADGIYEPDFYEIVSDESEEDAEIKSSERLTSTKDFYKSNNCKDFAECVSQVAMQISNPNERRLLLGINGSYSPEQYLVGIVDTINRLNVRVSNDFANAIDYLLNILNI